MTDDMRSHRETSSTPVVSVIIAAHNEAEFINDCIESVLNCGHPRAFLEILVVDHSSTDATKALALRAGATVLQLKGGRIGAVRNTGLRAARGELVAYVDADCLVPTTWLQSAIVILERNSKIGAVGGPCLSPKAGTWVERSLAPCRIDPAIVKPAKALATSSLITRTSLLNEVGQFNETMISGEDDDISNRIRQRGLSLALSSDCHIVHRGYPRTWWGAAKKEIWHGSNHIEVRSDLDLTLLLTIIFLLSTAGILISLPAALILSTVFSTRALTLSALLQFVPPFLYALKRLRQWPRDWYLMTHFILVGYAYFLGHGIGVLSNLSRRASLSEANSK